MHWFLYTSAALYFVYEGQYIPVAVSCSVYVDQYTPAAVSCSVQADQYIPAVVSHSVSHNLQHTLLWLSQIPAQADEYALPRLQLLPDVSAPLHAPVVFLLQLLPPSLHADALLPKSYCSV